MQRQLARLGRRHPAGRDMLGVQPHPRRAMHQERRVGPPVRLDHLEPGERLDRIDRAADLLRSLTGRAVPRVLGRQESATRQTPTQRLMDGFRLFLKIFIPGE